jgi:hypothetical protein
MSHGPQLMLNPSQWRLLGTRAGDKLLAKPELEKETEEVKWDKWRRCMDAIALLRAELETLRPDVVLVVGDDQHENILNDNTPRSRFSSAPKRCVQFGRALAAAIRRSPGDQRVVVVASGGLSHTKTNEKVDQEFLDKLKRNDVNGMAQMAASLFVEGTSEILNWIIVAAADQKAEVIDCQPLYRAKTGVGCAMGFAR